MLTDALPTPPNFLGVDHITLLVGNAKQAATYYCARFGFKIVGYRGLETGDRSVVSYAVVQDKTKIVIQSPLEPSNLPLAEQLGKHGDFVKDIAMEVSDTHAAYEFAINNEGRSIREPWVESDKQGEVVMATIAGFGDVTHTFVDRSKYSGEILPKYNYNVKQDPLLALLPEVGLLEVDHFVANTPEGQMDPIVSFYENTLGFKRYWNPDDHQLHSDYSALRIKALSDTKENIKMSVAEPAPGKRKSQNQEFCEYFGGAGVHHIALTTQDICLTVSNLAKRGVEFLTVPSSYYDDLERRLQNVKRRFNEDIDKLRELNILVDCDECGYLLQIFTKPLQDRPTHFIEIIQRSGHNGYGAGNFRALFEAIEREQIKRGNI